MTLGSTVTPEGVAFSVHAPLAEQIEVEFQDEKTAALSLTKHADGTFGGLALGVAAGALYRYRIDRQNVYPDPYSRYQPQGPHGPSSVVDPNAYRWQDAAWPGLTREHQVVYEIHLGTFTPQGTYQAAAEQLAELRDLGITCIELMPVNEFVGRFGWGYDGVNWFAPFHHYGTPDDLRDFVSRAHALHLGVILDVVYNHFGQDGNFLDQFATDYFTTAQQNPWGAAPNYAYPAMRRMAIDNAAYWIREYHFDGLRLDATQSIHDPTHPSVLSSLVKEATAAARGRTLLISAEDYLQRASLLHEDPAIGAGIHQLWNDDFHHAARVALTGNHSGYFKDYRGTPQEMISTAKHGFLFQGQYSSWEKALRGSPVRQEPRESFVVFIQNHDQVANTLYGRRIESLTSPQKLRALTAVMLLGPNTPLLFMGQEFAASSPFAYFADYHGDVAATLWNNRKRELAGFEHYMDLHAQALVLDPCSLATVRASTLDFSQRQSHGDTYRLYRDLLSLRRTDPVLRFRPQRPLEGAVLENQAWVLRWFSPDGDDRLLITNLGPSLDERAWAEPLLAAPTGKQWTLGWSSESPEYGGMGSVSPARDKGWLVPAEASYFMMAEKAAV